MSNYNGLLGKHERQKISQAFKSMSDDTSGQRIARAFSHLLDHDAQVGIATVIDTDADHHYQTGWDDAIQAAAKIVNDARFAESHTDLRSVAAEISGLKGLK